jgi:hypothetical protein
MITSAHNIAMNNDGRPSSVSIVSAWLHGTPSPLDRTIKVQGKEGAQQNVHYREA